MNALNGSDDVSQQTTERVEDGSAAEHTLHKEPPVTHRSFWFGLVVLTVVAVIGIGGQVLVLRGIDQYSKARLTLDATQLEIRQLEASLPDLRARTQTANVDLAAAEARLAEQRNLLELGRRAAASAREEAEAADALRRQDESAATAAREEAQALQTTIVERRRTLATLVSEIEQREVETSDLTAITQRLQMQLERLDAQRTALETEIGRQQSTLADLERGSTTLRDQQQVQDQQLAATRGMLVTARQALEAAQSEASAASDLSRRQTLLEAEVATLTDRRDVLAREVAAIEQQERLAVRTIAEAEATTQRLAADRVERQADLGGLSEAIAAATGRRDALAREVTQTTEQVARLRAEQERLQAQIASLRLTQAELAQVAAALEEARRDQETAARAAAELTQQIQSMQAEGDRLENRRNTLRLEVQDLEGRVARAGEVARDTTLATLSQLIAEGEALIGRIRRARQEPLAPKLPEAELATPPGGER